MVSWAFDIELGNLKQQIESCKMEYHNALATQKAPQMKYTIKGVTKNHEVTKCSKCNLFV